jgi:hypothetical protein
MNSPYSLGFSRKKPPIFLSEFLEDTKGFKSEERRALLFSLTSGASLPTVLSFNRATAYNKFTDFERGILDLQMPHIKCKSAFWSFRGGKVALPMYYLDKKFKRLRGESWESYRSKRGKLMLYSFPLDLAELASYQLSL